MPWSVFFLVLSMVFCGFHASVWIQISLTWGNFSMILLKVWSMILTLYLSPAPVPIIQRFVGFVYHNSCIFLSYAYFFKFFAWVIKVYHLSTTSDSLSYTWPHCSNLYIHNPFASPTFLCWISFLRIIVIALVAHHNTLDLFSICKSLIWLHWQSLYPTKIMFLSHRNWSHFAPGYN